MTDHEIEPGPAIAYPATQAQRWRPQLNWWLDGPTAVVVVLAVVALAFHPSNARAIVLAVIAVVMLLLAWWTDPVLRQRRLLRRYPWVEYQTAAVTRYPKTKVGCVVSFVDARGATVKFAVSPNDDDYQDGQRPVWYAGRTGAQVGVISLRQGDCTGLAIRTTLPGDSPRSGAEARPGSTPASAAASAPASATTASPSAPARIVTSGPAADHPATRGAKLPLGARSALERILGDNPWVAFPAEVSRGGQTNPRAYSGPRVRLLITDEAKKVWWYEADSGDTDYAEGPQTIWVAGALGSPQIAVSLHEGADVHLAHSSLQLYDPTPP